MRRQLRFAAATAALASALSGCATGPGYIPASAADLGIPERYHAEAEVSPSAEAVEWWNAFGDPTLSELMGRALDANLDIDQARSRLAQARESARQSQAARLPYASASASAGRTYPRDGAKVENYSASIDAQWSADLFGELRGGYVAAEAAADSAYFRLADVRTAIAAELARNYVDERSAAVRIRVARDALSLQQQNSRTAQWRLLAGLSSASDAAQARGLAAQTAATIPALERAQASAAHRLAVLTAQAPGSLQSILQVPGEIPRVSDEFAIAPPAEVLRRRPDVRAAERDLAAASARIGVAKSRLYPSLTLTGTVGASAIAVSNLSDLLAGGLTAALSQWLFDGGLRRSAVRQQEAEAQEAFDAYRGSVLSALEDIENALVERRTATNRAEALARRTEASDEVARLERIRYRSGLIDISRLNDAEQSLLSAQDALADAQADQATAVIQLQLAAGGGWDPDSIENATE